MVSEIDEKVAPCRKMKMILKNLNMIKYVTVENKKNKKKITVLNIFQHLSPVNWASNSMVYVIQVLAF